jgi:uncharacterized membrane protein YccC
VSAERMMLRIVFLIVGVMFSWFTFDLVLNRTENPILAFLSIAVVLAFWIGMLKVIVKVGA